MFLMKEKQENQETFGQRLREARREKGLTQEKLSKLTRISRRAIVHYENYGKRPPVEKLKLLAEALEITTDRLIGTEETSTSDEKLSYSLMKRLRVIEQLSTRDQKAVFHFINTLAKNQKKKKP